jgi:predicted FMN-binding regulatory protein PaiB
LRSRGERCTQFVIDRAAGFEMPIDRIEGKFKLRHNRSQDDRVGMLEGLDAEKSSNAEALAAFIRTAAGEPQR